MHTLIIGAGIAGLSAAQHLCKHSRSKITILEASHRVGGRMHTVKFGQCGDEIVELGANWIHGASLNNSIYVLASENKMLDPQIKLDRMSGYCYRSDGMVICRDLTQKVCQMFWQWEEEASSTALGSSPTHYSMKANLNSKLEHLLQGSNPFPVSDHADVRSVFNCIMNLCEFHNGGFCEQHPTGDTGFIDLPGGDIMVPMGMRSVVMSLANKLPNGTIKFGHEVNSIQMRDKGTNVTCTNGQVLFADHVIVTIPLGYLKKHSHSLFSPQIPVSKKQAIQNIGFGKVNKIFLLYDRPFWNRGNGGIKLGWLPDEVEMKSPSEWYKRIFAFDEVLNNSNALVAWVSGPAAEYMESLSKARIISDLTKVIRQFLKNPSIPEPIRIMSSEWVGNPYSLGSYSHFKTRTSRSDIEQLANPLFGPDGRPLVMFAGEATSANFYSTMHGARSSGLREADRLIKYYSNPCKCKL